MNSQEVKVQFNLTKDEDDWPPFTTEFVWATPLSDVLFRLNNVPFFATEVSMGDEVIVSLKDGNYWFLNVATKSTNSTVHVFCFDDLKRLELQNWAQHHDCVWEYAYKKQYIALSIPCTVEKSIWLEKLQSLESFDENGFEFEVTSFRH